MYREAKKGTLKIKSKLAVYSYEMLNVVADLTSSPITMTVKAILILKVVEHTINELLYLFSDFMGVLFNVHCTGYYITEPIKLPNTVTVHFMINSLCTL